MWTKRRALLIGQAAHVIDCIQWYMNSPAPVAVTCTGTKPAMAGAEVPETATISMEFPEYLAVFTLGYRAMRYNAFNDQIQQYHGDKARLDLGRESYALWPESQERVMKAEVEDKAPGALFNFATLAHVRNFLECCASRKEPNAPVEAGQATNLVLCMAMESLRSGKRLRWNAGARLPNVAYAKWREAEAHLLAQRDTERATSAASDARMKTTCGTCAR